MKGGFLGVEGPRGWGRPLSPCSLPASGICPQAFSGTLGHQPPVPPHPWGFVTVLGLHCKFS